jgi:hypothetical protein
MMMIRLSDVVSRTATKRNQSTLKNQLKYLCSVVCSETSTIKAQKRRSFSAAYDYLSRIGRAQVQNGFGTFILAGNSRIGTIQNMAGCTLEIMRSVLHFAGRNNSEPCQKTTKKEACE